MNKQEILAAFDRNKTDKGTALHEYHRMYADVFKTIGTPTKMLEIGVLDGHSLAAWCELFPDAEIVGADIKKRPVPPAAERAQYIVANSTNINTKEFVGSGYDIIIDDGDHRPASQWLTFNNLRDCWNRAYVIEDVIGREHADLLTRQLQDKGYRNLATYSSKKTDARMQMNGVMKEFAFYSIVVYKDV